MKYGPKQVLLSADVTAALHWLGDTSDAGVTNATANRPLLNTGGAIGVVFRVWCTGGATATLILQTSNYACFQGAAGAIAAAFPGAGSGNAGSYEICDIFPVAAIALATFPSAALAATMQLRPRIGAAASFHSHFLVPHMFLGFTTAVASCTGLNIEAKCLYPDGGSPLDVNSGLAW